MTRKVRNEKGMTLVELLAVFVISGMVVLLIIAIYLYVQNQFQQQSEQSHQLTDVTIAMKEITKDIRSREILEWDEARLTFTDGKTYELHQDVLFRNDAPYIYKVDRFVIEMIEDELSIEIISLNGQEISTTLIVR